MPSPLLPALRRLLGIGALLPTALLAQPLISEIMYHPPGPVEDLAQEWLELHNPTPQDLDLSHYRFSQGITFTLPPGTRLAPNGYLVVAAQVDAFQKAHPGFGGPLVGGWTGHLSNAGEQIQLDDALGHKVNDLSYASEGDWAIRARGPLSFGHRGWDWLNPADGSGSSAELRQPALGNGSAQNWAPSSAPGGSPGAPNSTSSPDLAPLIKNPQHRPLLPLPSDPVTISCSLEDEAPNPTATLHWRLDGTTPFLTAPLLDPDQDGTFEATIPPSPPSSVVEWFLSASDSTQTRTWPAPAQTSPPGTDPPTFDQAVNALYQVEPSDVPNPAFHPPGTPPLYRLILTAADLREITQLQTTSGQEDSRAAFPCHFISRDGTGLQSRSQASLRNRGFGSALGPPNNFHLAFASDNPWEDRSALALNCQFPYSQMLGQAALATAGLPTQDAAIAALRLNGANLAQLGPRMYGHYARLEGRDAHWVQRHFPSDPLGNLYRLDDHNPGPLNSPPANLGSGEFLHEGSDPAAYSDTFLKETNRDANDYRDLAQFTRIVSAPPSGGTPTQPAIPDAAYPEAVAAVLDLDQFYRFLAADALIGNQEGGLQSGRADDVSLYRGLIDPRFRFIPHDLDDCFDIGEGVGNPVTRSLFSYDTTSGGVAGLTRLFNHPQLLPRYYRAVLDALDSWFNHPTLDPLIDQLLADWVPPTDGSAAAPNRGIAEIKAYIDARRANILSQIQQTNSLRAVGSSTSPEGYPLTATGALALSGTFQVAHTYAITVNGQPAQQFYRDASPDLAGTWKMAVPPGGGGILHPGLNQVAVAFLGSSGQVLERLTAPVFYQAPSAGTPISGTLASPGTLVLTAPDSYVPGVPVLVRVDLLDSEGQLNRAAWNSTAALTATNGTVLTPSAISLTNGRGSALLTFGGSSGGSLTLFAYGSGGTGSANSGAPGSPWKALTNLTTTSIAAVPPTWKDEAFDDSAWPTLLSQTGYGDGDENAPFPRVDYNPTSPGTQSAPAYLFRSTFTIPDPSQIASLTGQVKFDDTCAVYVNGQQIYRHSDLSPNAALTEFSETTTPTTRENATADLTVPLALLRPGPNTIAVEVHQHDSASSDVTFDLRLAAALLSPNPGNFSLTASADGLAATKNLTSLADAPATTASGTLPPGPTTWSGLVRVTGDLTVPAGATLAIAPGTHVLLTGTAAPGDASGTDIIVNGGTLAINGTLAQPVSLTAADPATRWGQIYLQGAQPTHCSFLLLSHAGHAPGQGHANKGPLFRLQDSHLALDDCALGDSPAKGLLSSGACDLTMNRTLLARLITGPETGDGTSLVLTDCHIQDILPHFRESNDPTPDDEDALYVHNAPGRTALIQRCVFARCGDDLFDCLGGPITVADSILRQGWDKGISLLNNDLTLTRTLIVDCDKAIVPKSNTASVRRIALDRCTLVSENHNTTLPPWGYAIPPTSPDADSPSTGLYTQNKVGQSHPDATLAISAVNCLILAESPVLVDAPYQPEATAVSYSHTRDTDSPATPPWPGTGNSSADPRFVSPANGDYHLSPTSPAINAGDPSTADPDGSPADQGALPTGAPGGTGTAPGLIRWTTAGSPYHITANATLPAHLTLRIDPGVSVWFNQNTRLTINGRLLAEGTADRRIVFSHPPGTVLTSDVDPIKNGTQTGAPKWGGIRIYDSLALENVVRYCDFINAQGTSTSGPDNFGSIGFIRSRGWVDNCTWAGTHLRMCYGRNSIMTVTHNVFPDMFILDPVLGRIENTTDFVPSADNNQEPLKVEYPTTDPEVANNTAYPNGQPYGGHWRVYYNDFHGNRGHNDVFDADSGRWGQPGQFLLDCRYNWFHGLSGDEHIDLGGDAYIASNTFERATKDQWTSDTGYSNAISSGDKGSGTTILLARNRCFDLDHVINCKLGTAAIFEHNTVARLNPDFTYASGSFTQNVKCAPVNFFIPEDGSNPSYGDGAYLGYNLISNVPRLFSGADSRKVAGLPTNDITTKIEFHHNLLSLIADPAIGPNHPGTVFDSNYGPNEAGQPGFIDQSTNDFSLRLDSPARGSAPGDLSYGAEIPEWAYLIGGPSGSTSAPSATFTVGGPGIVAYQWRLNGGPWSPPIQIGSGGVMPRGATPTQRQSVLRLADLTPGPQVLEVLGQDMAGNWQHADPARALEGLPQALPTSRSWTIDPNLPIRLSEVVAHGRDTIELHNPSTTTQDLGGWRLTDHANGQDGYLIPPGTLLPADQYLVLDALRTGFGLDADGDAVFLFDPSLALRDSLRFGTQAPGYSLARDPATDTWTLALPTPSAPNRRAQLGDPRDLRLSEWFAAPAVRYPTDWLELVNRSPLPVSLAGVTLTDNPAVGAPAHAFAPLSFLAPGGYAVYLADSRPQDGPAHLSFSLDAQQDELVLASGGTVIDRATFGPATLDWSTARTSSGIATPREVPTRGFDLAPTDPAWSNAQALQQNLRLTEIMFHPIGGSDFEYIELTNTGITPLDLDGVRFTEGIAFSFGPTTLAPGAHLVLAAQEAAFLSRYGPTPTLAGHFTGKLDNSGETLGLTLPPPFDGHILRFAYQNSWFPAADGSGRSLELLSPFTAPNRFDNAASWAPSSALYGSPADLAAPEPNRFAQWAAFYQLPASPAADSDADGIDNLTEFSLASNPRSALPPDGIDHLPSARFAQTDRGTSLGLHFSLEESALPAGFGRAGLRYVIQDSSDLATWRDLASKAPEDASWQTLTDPPALFQEGPSPAGRRSFTVAAPNSSGAAPRQYLRLSFQLAP